MMRKIICLMLAVLIIIGGICHSALADAGDAILSFARQNFTSALRMSGRNNFDGYCGACVSYQLVASGITGSLNNFNGNQAYRHFASKRRTDTGYEITPFSAYSYSLRDILLMMNVTPGTGSFTPLLLGFNKGTASNAGQTYGHTMFIYAVSDGNVYYADSMYPTVAESVRVLSIDEFCKHYSDYPETARTEFVFDGAIRFCKYVPVCAKISANKYMYAAGEEIIFDVSAVGASKYYIGINKDGQRIKNVVSYGGCSVVLDEPGVYTAYATAVNSFGATDSYAVSFEVMNQAPVEQWIGVNRQEAAVGEMIPISFDARYATGYFVGTINPDGTMNAVNTNGVNSHTLCFDKPGVYTVFVTCVNIFGYVDTAPVSITVK